MTVRDLSSTPEVRRSTIGGVDSRALWVPLGVYAAARAFSATALVWAGQFQRATQPTTGDPTETYFVHSPLPADPGYLGIVTNWDGQWYRYIAEAGLSPAAVDPSVAAGWAWAFPPGYPMVVSATMSLTRLPFPLAAALVSTLLGAIAMVLVYRLVLGEAGPLNALAATVATSCFITSPLLQVAYSESLALLLVVSALVFITRRRPWPALAAVLMLCFTRQVSPPIAVVAAIVLLIDWRRAREMPKAWPAWGALVLASVLGVLLWPAIATLLGGGSGADRVQSMTANAPAGWFGMFAQMAPAAVSIPLTLALAIMLVAWRKRNEWGAVLSSWAAAYPIYVLLVTPFHTGILRYLLLAFPFGMLLSGSSAWSPRARTGTLAVGCAVLLCLQVLWVRYSFIYGDSGVMP